MNTQHHRHSNSFNLLFVSCKHSSQHIIHCVAHRYSCFVTLTPNQSISFHATSCLTQPSLSNSFKTASFIARPRKRQALWASVTIHVVAVVEKKREQRKDTLDSSKPQTSTHNAYPYTLRLPRGFGISRNPALRWWPPSFPLSTELSQHLKSSVFDEKRTPDLWPSI